MLPTKEEQDAKYQEIRSQYGSFFNCSDVAQEYAKWYATKVIKHCAEVAKLRSFYSKTAPNTETAYTHKIEIDKQSILNVINEL